MELTQNSLFDEETSSNSLELDFSNSVGDPMVEIGRLGLIKFCGKEKFSSFDEFEEIITTIIKKFYIGKIFLPFWLNSPLSRQKTNKLKIDKTLEKFRAIKTSYIKPCSCCGEKTNVVSADRTIYPLGVGIFNFNSSFLEQFNICIRCYSSLFFLPLNSQIVKRGKEQYVSFLLGRDKVNEMWINSNKKEINKNLVKGNSDYLIISKFSIFENLIYSYLEKIVKKQLDINSIVFYFFRNSNTSTELDFKIIEIYLNQVEFLNQISPYAFAENGKIRRDQFKIWHFLIAKNFYSKKTVNLKINTEMKSKHNRVISSFINGLSIFNIMKKDFESEYKKFSDGKQKLNYSKAYRGLIFKYLKEVRKMNKDRLDFLKKLANNLASLENGNKILDEIGRCKRVNDFRMILIKNMEIFYKSKKEKLFSAEDFVYKIFPKDEYFSETRDILIVAMYEVLADKLEKEKIELEITKTIEEDNNE